MKYTSPFLGEIDLTKLGETSKHLMGESRVDTIYVDEGGDYYIDTWTTTGGDNPQLMFLRKEIVDKINELSKQ